MGRSSLRCALRVNLLALLIAGCAGRSSRSTQSTPTSSRCSGVVVVTVYNRTAAPVELVEDRPGVVTPTFIATISLGVQTISITGSAAPGYGVRPVGGTRWLAREGRPSAPGATVSLERGCQP